MTCAWLVDVGTRASRGHLASRDSVCVCSFSCVACASLSVCYSTFDLPAAVALARTRFPALSEADVAGHIKLLTVMGLLDEDEDSASGVEHWWV